MYTLDVFFNVWKCWEVSESVSNVYVRVASFGEDKVV